MPDPLVEMKRVVSKDPEAPTTDNRTVHYRVIEGVGT